MTLGRPDLTSVFQSIDRVKANLREKLEPAEATARFRLVQDLVARLPHKYLAAATSNEIEATEKGLQLEGLSRKELKLLRTTMMDLFDQLVLDKALRWHPLRGEDHNKGNAVILPEVGLTVAMPEAIFNMAATTLEPLGLSLHNEPSPAAALERARWFPFRFVISAYPIDAPAGFLENLRGPSTLCRHTGVVLVASDDQAKDAAIYLGRGANRVIPLSLLTAQIADVIIELDRVCERIRIRLPIDVALDGGRRNETWRTENVSRTGMLLRTAVRRDPGKTVGLAFKVPGQDRPIRLTAEVIRNTTFGREEFDGLGVRYLGFSSDGQYRLDRFLG